MQIYIENSLATLPFLMGWGEWANVQKTLFTRNLVKCSDVHRKLLFTNPQPIGVEREEVNFQKYYFARNCITYPDMYRKVILPSLTPHEVG